MLLRQEERYAEHWVSKYQECTRYLIFVIHRCVSSYPVNQHLFYGPNLIKVWSSITCGHVRKCQNRSDHIATLIYPSGQKWLCPLGKKFGHGVSPSKVDWSEHSWSASDVLWPSIPGEVYPHFPSFIQQYFCQILTNVTPYCLMHLCKCKEGNLAKVHHTWKICCQNIHGMLCGHVDEGVFLPARIRMHWAISLRCCTDCQVMTTMHLWRSMVAWPTLSLWIKKLLQVIANHSLTARRAIRKCNEFLQWQ